MDIRGQVQFIQNDLGIWTGTRQYSQVVDEGGRHSLPYAEAKSIMQDSQNYVAGVANLVTWLLGAKWMFAHSVVSGTFERALQQRGEVQPLWRVWAHLPFLPTELRKQNGCFCGQGWGWSCRE